MTKLSLSKTQKEQLSVYMKVAEPYHVKCKRHIVLGNCSKKISTLVNEWLTYQSVSQYDLLVESGAELSLLDLMDIYRYYESEGDEKICLPLIVQLIKETIEHRVINNPGKPEGNVSKILKEISDSKYLVSAVVKRGTTDDVHYDTSKWGINISYGLQGVLKEIDFDLEFQVHNGLFRTIERSKQIAEANKKVKEVNRSF